MAKINDDKDGASSQEEDNEEGMDIDLEGDDDRIASGNEERKTGEKKKSKKVAQGSDDDQE